MARFPSLFRSASNSKEPVSLLAFGLRLLICISVLLIAGGIIDTDKAKADVISEPILNPTNGMTYYLLAQSTWTDAYAEATAMGGSLVTVRNTDENSWIFETFSLLGGVNRNLWIGLHDSDGDGQFAWINGEPLSFTNWAPGEPNYIDDPTYSHSYVLVLAPAVSTLGVWNNTGNNTSSRYTGLGHAFPPFPNHGIVEIITDCNGNGILDRIDIAEGRSQDCQPNGVSDECESDLDGDLVIDDCDICPMDPSPTVLDSDEDGVGDACDNCLNDPNPRQEDCDGDGVGDVCDSEPDTDEDGFADDCDNCPTVANPNQLDADQDGWGDACESSIIHVDHTATGLDNGSSWSNAHIDLQVALAVARNSDGAVTEIWVAQGTYAPTGSNGDRFASFQLVNGVGIYGGFLGNAHPSGGETHRDQRNPDAHQTLLSGDLNENDSGSVVDRTENSYHVVNGSGVDVTSLIDGFIITGGNADEVAPIDDGGGIYIQSGSPIVRNCLIEGNFARGVGGGMANIDGSNPLVIDCVFVRNTADDGGGGHFARGDGGGMANWTGSNPTLINCSFVGNYARSEGGGMYNNASSPLVLNCEFSGNVAEISGGMHCDGISAPNLINCTLSGNTATEREWAGGMYIIRGSIPTISNCIFWGNSGMLGAMNEDSQIHVYQGNPAPLVNYSCIQGWTGLFGGTGSIGDDPLFVDSDGLDNIVGTVDDDLRLRLGSLCIDAADNSSVPPDTQDIDGDNDMTEPMPLDLSGEVRCIDDTTIPDTGVGTPPIVDMGAYEYDPMGDYDQDGVLNADDNCLVTHNPDQQNDDDDPLGDACDNCHDVTNPDQSDADDDDIGDACDVCPSDPDNDIDQDEVCGDVDNCPDVVNPNQADTGDGDGVGDVCDNCFDVPNPDQCDMDEDGIGDACDELIETALEFDGNDVAIIPHSPSLKFGDDAFTIEVWFKTSVGGGFFLDKRIDVDVPDGEQGFFLSLVQLSRAKFAVEIPEQGHEETGIVSAREGLNDGLWHHAVGVREGNEIRLYIDGTLEASAILDRPMNISNDNPIVIGMRHSFGPSFTGTLDEIRIWSVAKSHQEINDYMNISLVGDEPGLVAYHKFYGGCTEQALNDISYLDNSGWRGHSSGDVEPSDPTWILSDAPVAGPIDTDDDGILDIFDNCPRNFNATQTDFDDDGVGNACDNCILDVNTNQEDTDRDMVGNVCDNCPVDQNESQLNSDTDNLGDACDNCPLHDNPEQEDNDSDGMGDMCDDDDDNDEVADDLDNCPMLANADQNDEDADGFGDVCDSCLGTIPGVVVDAEGCPPVIPADLDRDGDVDQTDFGLLQACLTGPGVIQDDPACEAARIDDDPDVDIDDFGILQACMSGANVPADPNCVD